jgi:hypothetical protein
MTNVLLLPIPKSPLFEDAVVPTVDWGPAEVVVSVGIVSVTEASLDGCRSTVLEEGESPASG